MGTARWQCMPQFCSSVLWSWRTLIPCTSSLFPGSSRSITNPSWLRKGNRISRIGLLIWRQSLQRQCIKKYADRYSRHVSISRLFLFKIQFNVHVFVQEHVMIFSFILCVGLQQSEGKVNADVWAFLLTGGSKLPKESLFPNPAPQWLRSVCISNFPLLRRRFSGDTTCSLII